jgi:hypothetical protein
MTAISVACATVEQDRCGRMAGEMFLSSMMGSNGVPLVLNSGCKGLDHPRVRARYVGVSADFPVSRDADNFPIRAKSVAPAFRSRLTAS